MPNQEKGAAPQDDYDSPWKDAIGRYFKEFMLFYFLYAHDQIDWTIPYIELDTELSQLSRDAELGKRIADKLIQVTLLSGQKDIVYIHIEVQGQSEAEFAKRMFIYYYRIFDYFNQPVSSMAILADNSGSWRASAYSCQTLGCKLAFEFPIVKLNDYTDQRAQLASDPNAFALITLAHLITRETHGDMLKRYHQLWRLTKLLFKRDWNKQRILDLYAVLDWMMRLPPELSKKIWQNIEKFEEKQKMKYVTTVERFIRAREREEGEKIGMQIGEQMGEQKGVQIGVQIGRQEQAAFLLLQLLASKFGALPAPLMTQVQNADNETLSKWVLNVLHATTLAHVFGNDAPIVH